MNLNLNSEKVKINLNLNSEKVKMYFGAESFEFSHIAQACGKTQHTFSNLRE